MNANDKQTTAPSIIVKNPEGATTTGLISPRKGLSIADIRTQRRVDAKKSHPSS